MVYEVRKYGDSALREVAKEVDVVDDEIREILNNMVDTMYDSQGVGLAAPQVGISKRMFVCDQGDGVVRKIINPKLEIIGDELTCEEEGCLSIPGIYKKVERAAKLKINYLNENGEEVEEIFDEYLAKIAQHETDHLDAILFIDKISPMAKRMVAKKLNELKKETLKETQVLMEKNNG